ncbi:MAG: metal-binding protein [Chloracidobacterium sp.]|nr:metal-binding protein [Chloracidobacterium sp.]
MPSGSKHDAITVILSVPATVITYMAVGKPIAAATVGAAFLFGGLMFGPDLDTISRPYSRWSVFRIIWFPYRHFFKHRSRFSHGLLFGALFRVIYFLGVATILAYLAALIRNGIAGDGMPDVAGLARAWGTIRDVIRSYLGETFLLFAFLGLWLGAASHTLADIAGTFIKTGRREKFF